MTPKALKDYGPRQFPDRLGLSEVQVRRAVRYELIPPPGANGRWPAKALEDALPRVEMIRARVGATPDYGAVTAAQVLGGRLGFHVSVDVVVELHRMGVLPSAGEYRGSQTYDGCVLEGLDDVDVVRRAEAAVPCQQWDFEMRLRFHSWQFRRAVREGLIPPADPATGRWPADVVSRAVADVARIRKAIGPIPDVRGRRAADELRRRLGTRVGVDAVLELHRRGIVPVVGKYQGDALYDGGALGRVSLEVVEQAISDARILSTGQAATELGVRAVDVDHLVRLGRLLRRTRTQGRGAKRREVAAGHHAWQVRELLADKSLPWEAMRATSKGSASPLAAMAAPGPAVAVEEAAGAVGVAP